MASLPHLLFSNRYNHNENPWQSHGSGGAVLVNQTKKKQDLKMGSMNTHPIRRSGTLSEHQMGWLRNIQPWDDESVYRCPGFRALELPALLL